MSEAPNPRAVIGNNIPPVAAPTKESVLADLKNRFPDIDTKPAEFAKALKDFPEKIEDEQVAGALGDLLKQMTTQKASWKGIRTSEKRPWDGIGKVILNFFTNGETEIDKLLSVWDPRHQKWLDDKAARELREREEQIEAQRKEAARLEEEARAAEERKRAAEAEAEAARLREEQATREAEEADRRRKAAELAAREAEENEKRLAAQKKERERAEIEENKSALGIIRLQMKRAEKLNALCESEEATDDETTELSNLLATAAISGPVRKLSLSTLLTDEQKTEVEAIRGRVNALYDLAGERLAARQRKKLEKQRAEQEAAAAREADARDKRRKADEAAAEAARVERERLEAEADAARDERDKHRASAREARGDARDAVADHREATREQKKAEALGERAVNRADRLDRRLENTTEAELSQTRGELGTVASLTSRWVYDVVDEPALRATLGELGPHLMIDAIEGAVYRWMGAHRQAWQGERVEGALPGVVFRVERDKRTV